MYLLLSFFEKIDYDNDDKLIKKPFIIITIIYFIPSIVSKLLLLLYKIIVSNAIHSGIYEIIEKISESNYFVQFYSGVFFILTFAFLLSYLKKSKKVKTTISLIFLTYCVSIIVTVITRTISILVMNIRVTNNISVAQILTTLNYISTIASWLVMPLYILLTIFLIIDYIYPKYILVFSIGMIVLNILESLFVNRNLIISGIVGLLSIIFYFVIFLIIYLKQPKSINNKIID